MTTIAQLMAQVNAACNDKAREEGIATLGDLRGALKMLPPETPVAFADGKTPSGLCSYRGYYERLSIETSRHRDDYETKTNHFAPSDYCDSSARGVSIAEPVTAAEMVKALDLADGEAFEGWKGGSYSMHGGTFVHVGDYGDCGDAVVGIDYDGEKATLLTQPEEW